MAFQTGIMMQSLAESCFKPSKFVSATKKQATVKLRGIFYKITQVEFSLLSINLIIIWNKSSMSFTNWKDVAVH